MRLLIADHVSNAYESLRSNRVRTFLTGLGITIGVASVTIVLALSAGVSGVITRQIDALQGNIAVIRPQSTNAGDITSQQTFAPSTITEGDYSTIKKIAGIKQTAPIMIIGGTPSKNTIKPPATSIIATTPELQSIAKLSIKYGQFLDTITNQQTVVIGEQLSIDLFGTDQSVGQTLTIKGQRFTVIGILKRFNDPINFSTVDFDRTAIIHLSAGKKLAGSSAPLQQISFQADTAKLLPDVLQAVDQKLSDLHHGDKDYTIISGKDIAASTSQLFQIIQGVSAVIASISLLVGGIGIMNIMLVSVAERTREIGLRKAVGASNAHIIWQFLIESLIISLAGGVIGYVAGYIIAFIISTFLPFDPVFTWQIAGIAAGLSLGVGVIFGLYPAVKASRKDPIESLRQYH
ncbi:MAG: putative Efflux transporter, permease protein [Candidatus Saccharibacteria bacterium]|nr:putative Efflux transporter, permease protein [Candidatus Saccharibacteria bacterium]